jgi:ribosomal protein S18 acetylase RimI-like enzyme
LRIRNREAADLGLCVEALAVVHRTSGYPANWPADPARWLTPSGIVQAWIATTGELPVAGHLLLRQLPSRVVEVSRLYVVPAARRQGAGLALLGKAIEWAVANERDLVLEVTDHLQAARALYEQAGFRLVSTGRADWTTPDGQPVTLHRYVLSRHSYSERDRPYSPPVNRTHDSSG